jgi:hypothetical protein
MAPMAASPAKVTAMPVCWVAGLHESSTTLTAWTEEPTEASAAWIGDDVALLGRVLAGFPNLLHHPHMQDPLQCQ